MMGNTSFIRFSANTSSAHRARSSRRHSEFLLSVARAFGSAITFPQFSHSDTCSEIEVSSVAGSQKC